MPRDQFIRGSIGFMVFGVVGIVTATTSALDPASRASDGLANAVAGIIFFLAITIFSVWLSYLARHTAPGAAPWADTPHAPSDSPS